MSYRPITDTWLLAKPRPFKDGTRFHGAYPLGFLQRARDLLGVHISDPVLHVCAGAVRKYPYAGLGPNDRTLDIDPATKPNFLQDARLRFPCQREDEECDLVNCDEEDLWPAILIDPPYDEANARLYAAEAHDALPSPGRLLRNAVAAVRPFGRIGILHWIEPSTAGLPLRTVALITVRAGKNSATRSYTVFERITEIRRSSASRRKDSAA